MDKTLAWLWLADAVGSACQYAQELLALYPDPAELYDLLRHERDHGKIVWVMGPAFAFDHDARAAMAKLIENGYVYIARPPLYKVTRGKTAAITQEHEA